MDDGAKAGPVVAVDGPSGSGKSTVSRRLARRLGTRYLDTGAMYRAVTLAVLRAGADPHDPETVLKIASTASLVVGTDPAAPHITLDGEPVDTQVRGADVTANVSAVSSVPGVRRLLVDQQREIISAARQENGIVVEGRDIGTVVAPDAQLKVFLTASAAERARRRSTEQSTDLQATADDLARRDRLDSTRTADPLAQAPDAVVLDSTELGIDQVVERLAALLTRTTA
ncbi:MAG TPA: (d)CMP kinase [Micromonosporaceae bacterium]